MMERREIEMYKTREELAQMTKSQIAEFAKETWDLEVDLRKKKNILITEVIAYQDYIREQEKSKELDLEEDHGPVSIDWVPLAVSFLVLAIIFGTAYLMK
jgi:hypothetical protein